MSAIIIPLPRPIPPALAEAEVRRKFETFLAAYREPHPELGHWRSIGQVLGAIPFPYPVRRLAKGGQA